MEFVKLTQEKDNGQVPNVEAEKVPYMKHEGEGGGHGKQEPKPLESSEWTNTIEE